jgi:hypothetical protein
MYDAKKGIPNDKDDDDAIQSDDKTDNKESDDNGE